MGYSYGQNGRGNWVLSCDACGEVGGVRKRTCPYLVTCDSSRGARHALPYCPAPALCGSCYKRERATLHQDCEAGARSAQESYDATQTKIDAGEPVLLAAWGDWHEEVPAGQVGVLFKGHAGEAWYLIPEDEYDTVPRRPSPTPASYATAAPFHAISSFPTKERRRA